MKGQVVEALPLLATYAAMQRELCVRFSLDHKVRDDADTAAIQPRAGTVALGKSLWRFKQHGLGVRFERVSDGAVVEAHVAPMSIPQGLDAYRIQSYCESMKIDELEHVGQRHGIAQEGQLEQLLNGLAREGKLTLIEPGRHIYALAQGVK